MITLTVNGQKHALDIEPETPLLWVLRDELGLTGTKFGCGIAQCGACYCQSGQIMAAVALLQQTPKPSDGDIDSAITNICRCGTYPRIRAAIHRAAELAKG